MHKTLKKSEAPEASAGSLEAPEAPRLCGEPAVQQGLKHPVYPSPATPGNAGASLASSHGSTTPTPL